MWRVKNTSQWQPQWTLKHHKSQVYCVLPHPHDARLIATGSHDNTVVLWDISAGRAVRIFDSPQQHQQFLNRVTELRFSHDGSLLVVPCDTATHRIHSSLSTDAYHSPQRLATVTHHSLPHHLLPHPYSHATVTHHFTTAPLDYFTTANPRLPQADWAACNRSVMHSAISCSSDVAIKQHTH